MANKKISKDELLRLEAEQLASHGRLAQLVEQKKREQLDYESAERERLQRHILAPINGVSEVRIAQEDEYFPPPRHIRQLQHAMETAITVMCGADIASRRAYDDRSISASAVLASLSA